ncbi:MAG: flavodoxin family protein [Candidatus Methanofastidiosum sp.]|nr:flavodoxin family protein [Methanofastidiosum sp.]
MLLKKKILAIGGSPRKNGNTDYLLDCFIKSAKNRKIDFKLLYLRDLDIHPCTGCEKCRKDKICTNFSDDMVDIYPLIYESVGMIIGAPTHNYNVPALMKSFIDRLYCFYDFTDDRPRQYSSRLANQGRQAIIFGVGEQKTMEEFGFTLEALEMPLKALGYNTIFKLPVLGIFDKGAVKNKKDVISEAEKAGLEMAKYIENISFSK